MRPTSPVRRPPDEHLRIRFRAVPIALHDLRPVDDDLARLALRRGLARILLVHQPDTGPRDGLPDRPGLIERSEEHTSELQSLMRISYAVFCLKKKKNHDKVRH